MTKKAREIHIGVYTVDDPHMMRCDIRAQIKYGEVV